VRGREPGGAAAGWRALVALALPGASSAVMVVTACGRLGSRRPFGLQYGLRLADGHPAV